MEKSKILKIAATLVVATVLFSAFTKRCTESHPFIEKLISKLSIFSDHFAEEKVYLQLDRSFYEPHDLIWFSGWIRNANTLRADNVSEKLYIELIDPKGAVIEKQTILAKNGLAKGILKLNTPTGGLYKVKAYTNWQRNRETFFEREIQVQQVILPNLKMKLDFERKAFGPGDQVVAKLEVKDLEDEVLRLRNFTYMVSLDGKQILKETSTLDFDGKLDLQFSLPKKLNSSDGLLQILIPHNGQTESISRAIPITLKDIDLQFFPEGGDLIAGLSTKVAFKALNEFGKPADVEGVILNEKGEVVADFKSFHMGMGATKLWPERGNSYSAKITKPAGIDKVYTLPGVNLKGIQLGLSEHLDDKLTINIQATRPQAFHLVAQANDKILFSESSIVKENSNIDITTSDFPMGITRLSLFDEKGSIAAERLVFLNPHKKLNINIQTNKKQYLPREEVKMDITVKDFQGNPVVGNFGLSVSDDKLLTYADDKQGHILSKLFLESELKGTIEEPDFYFDEKEEKAIAALDYLLMTQGWRRFDWKEVNENEGMAATHQKERSWISGRVVNGLNEAVVGAEVEVLGTNVKTETDNTGYFIIKNFEIDNVGAVMKVSANGLKNVRKSIVEYKNDYHIVLSEGYGSISGLILSPKKKAARYTSIALQDDNGTVWKTHTDKRGEYTFKHITPGTYTLSFHHTDYQKYEIQQVRVWPSEDLIVSRRLLRFGETAPVIIEEFVSKDKELKTNDLLTKQREEKVIKKTIVREESTVQYDEIVSSGGSGINLDEITVVDYKVPLVSQDNTTSGSMVRSSDIRKFASKSISSIAASTAGMSQVDDGDFLRVRGSRSNATDIYVDGIRVSSSQVVVADVAMLRVMAGGIPAYYGGGLSVDLPQQNFVLNPKASTAVNSDYNQPVNRTTGSDFNLSAGSTGGYGGFRNYGYRYRKHVRYPSKIYAMVDQQPRLKTKKCNRLKSRKNCYDCSNEIFMEAIMDAIKKSKHYHRGHEDLLLEFFVNEKGEAGGLQLKGGGYHYYLRNEITKVFSQFKDWEPARLNFRKVAAKMVIPITDEKMFGHHKTKYQKAPEFYAPKYKSDDPVLRRNDFRSTVFWKPDVQTDEDGKATVSFCNSDDVTSLRVAVEGISNNGFVGEGSHLYSVQLPFSMSSKIPVVLLEGDEVRLPITLMNNTDELLVGELKIQIPDCFELLEGEQLMQTLNPQEAKTIYPVFRVKSRAVAKRIRKSNISFSFSSGAFSDTFDQLVNFQSDGFPITEVLTGTEKNNSFTIDVNSLRKGSMTTELNAYTNIVAEVMATCKRMLRQPGGCFEQTSSSNYPNVMVVQYLDKHGGFTDKKFRKKVQGYMRTGYSRLKGFECRKGGFSWYGKGEGIDALTAFGLMQFVEMRKVYPVDDEMIKRTAEWMLTRKDGKGGWAAKPTGNYRWRGNALVKNAYINWALSAAGYASDIKEEVEQSYQDVKEIEDPYVLALVANVLLRNGDERGEKLVTRLLSMQKPDGFFYGAEHSMTNSRGWNLHLETTALASLALMNSEQDVKSVLANSILAISKSKTKYGFGSTQSSVLCIKAMLEFADQSKDEVKEGIMALYVNDKLVQEQSYSTNASQSFAFDDFSHYLKDGTQEVEVRFTNEDQVIPFEMVINYASSMPENTEDVSKIKLQTTLSNDKIKQGETTRLTTLIKNESSEIVTSPIAIIGIPAGLSPQPWQLKKLQEQAVYDYYEITDNKVVFYLTELAEGEEKVIHLDLKADIPGKYISPASHAYLYYENDVMAWVSPTGIEILVSR